MSNVSSRVLSSEAPLTSTVEPTMTSSVLDCQLWNKKQVNCSSRLHSDPEQWRLGRNYLEQQIRTLRLQLDEMKIIRKHLRTIRPLAAKVHALDPKPHTRQPFFHGNFIVLFSFTTLKIRIKNCSLQKNVHN